MDLLADVFQKLEILADAAKYDVACTSSGSSRKGKKGMMGNAVAGESAIVLRRMEDVFPCSKFYRQMSAFMTANTARIAAPMIFRGHPLRRKKLQNLRFLFIGEIISKVCF